MENPYTPGTKEYQLLSNLIEMVYEIEEYLIECPAVGVEVFPDKVLGLIKLRGELHKEILDETRPNFRLNQ